MFRDDDVPEAVSALTTFDAPDYVDVFSVVTERADLHTPAEWARALMADAAGAPGQLVWRGMLGLRLAWPRSRYRIAGWEVGHRGDGWVRLEAASWLLAAEVVVLVEENRVTAATFLRYDRPPAALVWRVAGVVHRRAMPRLLCSAVMVLRSGPGRGGAC